VHTLKRSCRPVARHYHRSAVVRLITCVLLAGALASCGPEGAPDRERSEEISRIIKDYTLATDGTKALDLVAPRSWRVLDRPWKLPSGEPLGPGVLVSPDAVHWRTSWAIPGVFVGASRQLAEELRLPDVRLGEALDRTAKWLSTTDWSQHCRYEGVSLYSTPDENIITLFEPGSGVSHFSVWGFVRRWENCGNIQTTLLEVVAIPNNGSYVLNLQITIADPVPQQYPDIILKGLRVDSSRLP
jgi:hypothetical protein